MKNLKVPLIIVFSIVSAATFCQTNSSKPIELRLLRLKTLADIWGDLALHHSKLAGQEKYWDSVLTKAIPKVEKTNSVGDFVRVLNTCVFSALDDPSSYASVFNQPSDTSVVHIHDTFTVLKLASNVGYIAIPAGYGTRLEEKVYEALKTFGKIDRLVIDLRTLSKNPYPDVLPSLWAVKEINLNPTVTPIYWYYHTQGLYWLTRGNPSLKPLDYHRGTLKTMYPNRKTEEWHTINIPTVFIFNNNSYSQLPGYFDALQTQPNVAVVYDKTGPQWGGKILYPENIRVRMNTDMLIAQDGALGVKPDTILQNVTLPQLINLTDVILKSKLKQSVGRTRFTYQTPKDYTPPALPSLTREERITGLMKIWFNIKHFYAYPEHMTIDWEDMLFEWIPKVEKTGSSMEYYNALHEVTTKINDNHVWFRHPTLAFLPDAGSLSHTIPALLLKVEGKVLVAQIDSSSTGPNFPLTPGDEILAVDGKNIGEIESLWRKRISAAQESGFVRNVWEYAFAIRDSKDSIVTLRIQNKNGKKDVQIKKQTHVQKVTTIHPFGRNLVELLPGNIGFIRLYHIPNLESLDSAFRELKNTRGLIFDLRGGNAPYNYRFPADMRTVLIDRLVKEPFERRGGNYIYTFTDGGLPISAKGKYSSFYFPDSSGKKLFYDKPIVVITSSRQQSYGEGIFQILQAAKRVTFVGSPTVGTNGGMAIVKLPDGGTVSFTMVYVSQQDGKPFHGIGIVPDVKVEPTVQGIRTRKDEVLEMAVTTLNKKIAERN